MDISLALKSFGALSQESRLKALRILVTQGEQGMAAGELSQQLGIPQNTLSFHLAHLSNAGLVRSQKSGRSVIYCADIAQLQGLITFLLEDCCAADKATCKGVEQLLRKSCC